jgi:hypothetical protein
VTNGTKKWQRQRWRIKQTKDKGKRQQTAQKVNKEN